MERIKGLDDSLPWALLQFLASAEFQALGNPYPKEELLPGFSAAVPNFLAGGAHPFLIDKSLWKYQRQLDPPVL